MGGIPVWGLSRYGTIDINRVAVNRVEVHRVGNMDRYYPDLP